MQFKNYEGIIGKLSNPDLMADGLTELSEQLKKDEADYNSIVTSNNNLRDTNSKLALRITNVIDPPKPEPTREEVFYDKFEKHFENIKEV